MSERHFDSRVISKETIKPSSPTPPHLKTYNLSLTDKFTPKFHMPLVLFYPNYGSSRDQDIRLATSSQLLKKSLSQTLTQYYPFSGRFTTAENNRSYVDCNDEGVEFVEASIDATLSEFLLIHVNSSENHQLPLDQLFPTNGRPSYKGGSNQLVMVQLNYFSCGGVALAASMLHKVADTCTFCNFLYHWAAVTRQNSGTDNEHVLPLSPHFIYSSPSDIVVDIPEHGVPDKENNLVTKKFVFPNSKLAQLKAKAKDEIVNAAAAGEKQDDMAAMMINPTRIEVLSSLLYRCAVRAEKKVNSQSVDPIFSMTQSVNLRNRMVDPLPETSVGNIFWYYQIPTVSESELAISHLTARMKKAKKQLTGVTSSMVSQWLGQAASRMSASNNKDVQGFGFSSICGFPLYKIDFGWGKPVQVNLVPGYMRKNFFVLIDTPNGDGIEALVDMKEDIMAVFEKDDQLLAFAL